VRRIVAPGDRGSGRLERRIVAPGGRRSGRLGRLLRRAGLALRPLALALVLLALIAALSLLVAFPLWYFSTRSRQAFTIAVGGLLAAGLVSLLVRALRRAGRRAGGFRELCRRRILPGLRTTALVLAALGAVYGIALLVARIIRY
jgi:hypothetical protein